MCKTPSRSPDACSYARILAVLGTILSPGCHPNGVHLSHPSIEIRGNHFVDAEPGEKETPSFEVQLKKALEEKIGAHVTSETVLMGSVFTVVTFHRNGHTWTAYFRQIKESTEVIFSSETEPLRHFTSTSVEACVDYLEEVTRGNYDLVSV